MSKKYLVEITRSAQRDVLKIHDFIALDKEKAADKWVTTFEKKAQSLKQLPFRCEVIPEADILDVEYRHLLFGNYRIIYLVEDERVVILRVIHAARLLDVAKLRRD